jgi:hypothetical protein
MLWFHSVTIGGSVLCVRNKLHIIANFSNFTLSFDEKKLIFLKQNGQFYKS